MALAALAGGVAYSTLLRTYNLVMLYGFKCEALNEMDYFMLMHDEIQPHNIIVGAVFEKFDYDGMK